MKAQFLSALLLSAALPLAAVAQDNSSGSDSSGPTLDGSAQQNSGNGSSGDDSNGTGANSNGAAAQGNAGGDSTDPSAGSSTEQAGAGPGLSSANMFVTIPGSGSWRLNDLQGKTVYSADGSNIGEINDVVLSQNGSVSAVIIGVGGFLGMGEKNVAVNVGSLQVVPGDTSGPTAATSEESDDSPTGPGSNSSASSRLVLNVTRDQLESAPAYSGMASP
ncbi:hypothetical protein CXZ10_02385 [Pleomorphomonas diazotrophica]|uniref:PRC-barrel domain-containing protein n=1 Tax=Pleomorphomonas diazotrophica TaxID=1166257 RepID=A0A1I4R281_9HYPH|nr:PRC-barrel domain-containing protein [Pleomorphomonas diazotrophica]PKR90257.1 hypothetical protein CXZ10_02385 [Pleomorphomonas diazotrophica]SFM46361.1 Sporulation protein YlmC, PRC-barrel domain family [Pleomorphomonas diazotrophica]